MPVLRSLVSAVAVAAIAAGCRQPAPVAPEATARGEFAQPVAVTRLRGEPYPLTHYSGLTTAQRLVVRDEAAWRDAWAAIWRDATPAPPLPSIDFAREMVVVAALGERNSGGYGILIDSAAASGGGLRVFVRTTSPGPRCFVTGALTQPVDAARLPRVDGPVEFVERAEVTDCR